MAKIIWSERALDDINEIANFISTDSVQYAEEQVSSFFKRTEILEEQPQAGRVVPELNNTIIRQLLCGSYRLIYEVLSENEVSILTVHHQSRLIENNPSLKDKHSEG